MTCKLQEGPLPCLSGSFWERDPRQSGELDRVALGQRIFSNPSERDWSNRVQGKLIREALAEVRDRQAAQSDLFFMDIPLLIEQDYDEWFESVWLVAVSKETQLKRLMERNHLSELQAQERIRVSNAAR